jgi:hypothetical protein
MNKSIGHSPGQPCGGLAPRRKPKYCCPFTLRRVAAKGDCKVLAWLYPVANHHSRKTDGRMKKIRHFLDRLRNLRSGERTAVKEQMDRACF